MSVEKGSGVGEKPRRRDISLGLLIRQRASDLNTKLEARRPQGRKAILDFSSAPATDE